MFLFKYMTKNRASRTLELMVNAAVGAQDLVRIGLRNAEANLPFSEPVNDFYLYNWGDYMDGFQIALLTNWLGEKVADKIANYAERKWGQNNALYKIADNLRNNDNLMNVISGAIGSVAVIFAEITGFRTTPDSKDIPAGILGAITYMTVRYLVTRKHNSRTEDISPKYTLTLSCRKTKPLRQQIIE